MKMPRFTLPLVVLALAAAPPSSAAVAVDGRLDPDYGAPLAVQSTQTNVVDNTLGLIDGSSGFELDVVCPPPTPARAVTWGHLKAIYR
jgi:hypothetical protein